ncbi:MAG: MFS transporter [Planctomycetaceae bacterium]|nr:MFS transporter [Planctomycetaceae bacterium]
MDFLATPTRRRLLFSALYLSEGAPIGFIWLALPTWLRLADVSVEKITTLTALLVVPWTFKFAWAPLIDVLQNRWWTVRHWIVSAQLVMGGALLPLLWLDLQQDFAIILPLLLTHAFAAATQDVAIDALCIATTDPLERGRLNGWMQAGMLLGRAAFGGGALLLSTRIGTSAVVTLLLAVTTGSLVMVLGSRPPATMTKRKLTEQGRHVFGELRQSLRERRTWLGLAFAFIGGAAFKSLEVVIGPFLVDRGYTEDEIGLFTAGPMIGLMICGSLAGGWVADRMQRRNFVAAALLSFVVPICGLALSDLWLDGQRGPHLLVGLALTAFGIGVFTAASYAMFMDLTRPAIAATQFSAFMGATNGCESWSSFAIGRLIASNGYATAFLVMSAASLTALPLLKLMNQNSSVDDRSDI